LEKELFKYYVFLTINVAFFIVFLNESLDILWLIMCWVVLSELEDHLFSCKRSV